MTKIITWTLAFINLRKHAWTLQKFWSFKMWICDNFCNHMPNKYWKTPHWHMRPHTGKILKAFYHYSGSGVNEGSLRCLALRGILWNPCLLSIHSIDCHLLSKYEINLSFLLLYFISLFVYWFFSKKPYNPSEQLQACSD